MLVDPLPACFGARVSGVDLRTLDDTAFEQLHEQWLEFGLLLFPDQHLDRDEQNAFARRFGELEFPASPISNVRKDGTLRADDGSDDVVMVLRGNMGWHADSTYMPVQAKGAVFTAHTVPSHGGATSWADMRAAYDALSDDDKALLDGRTALHSLVRSQALIGHRPTVGGPGSYGIDQVPQRRPLVAVHPDTGRSSLLIGRHAYAVSGLDDDESEALLDRLVEAACQPPRIYTHTWTAGELVIWDNRRLLHRAEPWDMNEPRVMFHARIAGDPRTESAVG